MHEFIMRKMQIPQHLRNSWSKCALVGWWKDKLFFLLSNLYKSFHIVMKLLKCSLLWKIALLTFPWSKNFKMSKISIKICIRQWIAENKGMASNIEHWQLSPNDKVKVLILPDEYWDMSQVVSRWACGDHSNDF